MTEGCAEPNSTGSEGSWSVADFSRPGSLPAADATFPGVVALGLDLEFDGLSTAISLVVELLDLNVGDMARKNLTLEVHGVLSRRCRRDKRLERVEKDGSQCVDWLF